ncbi:hypothetical protein RHSIM_Rhsim05G0159700 [Rhododendron simsii]|uniref:Glabrous enhancer-binding protein-like DBD domain-containing protein n=1 Tax=Rhododendron simsii TaxID=118357 RepID=A0A834GYU2_RHOSS|nr:hypothetical protein RHSIM_Rhsim05G0159700 [Rhododendron simsii]
MASEEDHTVYPEDDDVLDDDEDDESEDDDVLDDDEDDDDDDTSSSNLAASQVTIAVPGLPKPDPSTPTAPHGSAGFLPPDPTRPRVDDVAIFTTPAAVAAEEKKPIAALDDSRKLFQRLWTDEDEIELLQGFLDYSTQRGIGGANSSHHHHDTAAFYDQIKSKLQLEFNKNQLVEKLRRLKKKYRNALSKMESGKEFVFKSPHDQAAFDISKKIWSNDAVRGGGGFDVDDSNPNPSPISVNLISFANQSNNNNNNGVNNTGGLEKKVARPRKRARGGGVKIEENRLEFNTQPVRLAAPPVAATATSIPNLIEETVRSCLSPLFKELLQSATNGAACGGGGLRGFGGVAMAAMSPVPLSFGGLNLSGIGGGGGDIATDERWRKQQILELEVYSKRLELVQDQIKSALAELRSTGS